MQVKLKVIGGKHDGREIGISVPEFVIGRGEEAHLRPSSDLISRKHCSIRVGDGKVVVQDLGSRNGTLINGKLIEGEREIQAGDVLRVGRLQFEFLIDVAQPSAKRPKVKGMADALARTASGGGDEKMLSDESITDWLSGGSESAPKNADTQQFKLDETSTKLFTRSDEAKSKAEDSAEEPEEEEESKSGFFKKKKGPGKLPSQPNKKADSTKSAADDVLRKFFNRR